MSWPNARLAKGTALSAAALFFLSASVQAGDRVHSGDRTASYGSQVAVHAPAPVTPPRNVSLLVTWPVAQAPDAFRVTLHGQDGQPRTFPVEGGRTAIQFRQVILRPGESLAIRWTSAK
jgi:hypothetical protein